MYVLRVPKRMHTYVPKRIDMMMLWIEMVILQFAICVSQGHLIHDCSVVFSPPFGSGTM